MQRHDCHPKPLLRKPSAGVRSQGDIPPRGPCRNGDTDLVPSPGSHLAYYHPLPPTRPSRRGTCSPLMTSCRSISLWLSPATTSLPTMCCQFWASGSSSRSDSWPRSSSRRWGRRASAPNPRLGDSMLLGKRRKDSARGPPLSLLPRAHGKRRPRTPHSPAAHLGGEGRGWVLQRPVERSQPSAPAAPAPRRPS